MLLINPNGFKTLYRYRVNENVKSDKVSINGVTLSKSWKSFDKPMVTVHGHVKTLLNPTNSIEHDIVFLKPDGTTEVIFLAFDEKIPERLTKKEISFLSKPEVYQVCLKYLIDARGKQEGWLVEEILRQQDVFHNCLKEYAKKKDYVEKSRADVMEKLSDSGITTSEAPVDVSAHIEEPVAE